MPLQILVQNHNMVAHRITILNLVSYRFEISRTIIAPLIHISRIIPANSLNLVSRLKQYVHANNVSRYGDLSVVLLQLNVRNQM